MTLTPTKMVEADAAAVYDAGWSEAALFDAVQTCALFNMMNRILEGTGITSYYLEPETVDEAQLVRFRSKTCYTDFGRSLGIVD
ncbi:MAG: hypothetical protein GY952_11385 [Rhodobacteraceae bacterium]|nr:hypothetical protein [Paracoccaceae bacterium]